MATAVSKLIPKPGNKVLKMLSHGAPRAEVLNELCNFIGARLPGVIPTVLLLDGDGTHLRRAAGPQVPKIWNNAFDDLKVPSRNDFRSTTGIKDECASVTDMRSDPAFAGCWDLALNQGVQAAWSVPILSKDGTALGSILLFCPTLQPLEDRDLEFMEQATYMAAIAIECHRNEEELRNFSRKLYQSQDEERRRIARELHDSTGQKLAVLEMTLDRVKKAAATQPPQFDEVLSECATLTSNISAELRTLSYLLHPPLLEECGLNTAIEWYVSGINQRQGLHVEVEIAKGLHRLSEEAELAIFRIVQASLTNVHLHSRASEAKVKIEQNFDGVIVAVSDDGQGIPDGVLDHSSRVKTVGIGITGMRERVKQLGGRLEIETGCTGTKVKATIPNRHFRVPVLPPIASATQTVC
jgi:signal transduction histidine kinase